MKQLQTMKFRQQTKERKIKKERMIKKVCKCNKIPVNTKIYSCVSRWYRKMSSCCSGKVYRRSFARTSGTRSSTVNQQKFETEKIPITYYTSFFAARSTKQQLAFLQTSYYILKFHLNKSKLLTTKADQPRPLPAPHHTYQHTLLREELQRC